MYMTLEVYKRFFRFVALSYYVVRLRQGKKVPFFKSSNFSILKFHKIQFQKCWTSLKTHTFYDQLSKIIRNQRFELLSDLWKHSSFGQMIFVLSKIPFQGRDHCFNLSISCLQPSKFRRKISWKCRLTRHFAGLRLQSRSSLWWMRFWEIWRNKRAPKIAFLCSFELERKVTPME